jgi:DNA modification methylase
MTYQLWLGDCLEEMSRIEDGSIDMILADLPYGTTACKWDVIIPFEPLWKQYKRVIKKRGAVVLFGSQPFTSMLVMSNPAWFKYSLVWDKKFAGNFNNAKYQPMMTFEDVLIFGNGRITYNPQMTKRDKPIKGGGFTASQSIKQKTLEPLRKVYTDKYPVAILEYPRALGKAGHPTQKPVALLSYLIKTYTNPGELVLDNTCGSGSTLEAAELNGRNSIGIEKDAGYFEIARNRLEQVTKRLANQDLPMFAEVTP